MTDPRPFSKEWFKLHFDRTGTSQADLVRYMQGRSVHTDAQKISKSINDKRKFTDDEEITTLWFFKFTDEEIISIYDHTDPKFAEVLRRNPRETLSNVGETARPIPNAGLPERAEIGKSRLPIYGVSVGGNARSKLLFNGDQVGTTSRPQSLADVKDAYATYVHGDSMEPRYEAGEVVLVHPTKPYKRGNYVVAQIYDNDGDPPFGYVKRFISFGNELVLEQLNPPEGEDRLLRFPRERVLSVHRIVGTLDE